MRLFNGCGGTLSTMAGRASELIQIVRNYRMFPIRLHGHIGQAGFFQTHMATGTSVNHAQLGQPDLLNSASEVPLQRVGVTAIAEHLPIAMLIMPPLAEKILGGSNRHRRQKNQTDDAESAHAVSEELLPERRKFCFHD